MVTERQDSSADLAAGLVEDAQRLVRLEIDLAKQEIRELAIRNGVAVALFAVAGVLALTALLVGIPVLIVMAFANHVVAAAVWIGVYMFVAAVLGLVGKSMLKIAPPKRTLTSLQETKEWLVHQIRSTGR